MTTAFPFLLLARSRTFVSCRLRTKTTAVLRTRGGRLSCRSCPDKASLPTLGTYRERTICDPRQESFRWSFRARALWGARQLYLHSMEPLV